jgi:hypothetical protein|tara:strand:- start:487 stop:891 length:405 start_codon:yes stop_codon:yes gene_type:complete
MKAKKSYKHGGQHGGRTRKARTDRFGVRSSSVSTPKKSKSIETIEDRQYGDKVRATGIKDGIARKKKIKRVNAKTGEVRKEVIMRDDTRRAKKKANYMTGAVKSKSKNVGQKRAGRILDRMQAKQDRMDKRARR